MVSGLPPSPIKKTRLVRIAHVCYKHADIDKAKQFAADFGFVEAGQNGKTTFFRGYGTEPFSLALEASDRDEFGGAAFVVESEEDLVHASKSLPKECRATEVHSMKNIAGGGRRVTFYDPVDGFPFHLIHGQTLVDRADPGFPLPQFNSPTEKKRNPNQFQRFQKRAAPVHKLGHFGMCVTDFARCYAFYTSVFNLHPSELVHDAAGVDRTVFFRLDRGAAPVDHHCFFFFEGPRAHVHHASFETHDLDAQMLGHDWLRHRGYVSCWGVGRHVMGSQIFDYWFDPAGFIMEHYVDGDLLDMREPTHRSEAAPDNLHVWGPEVPATFLQ
ncbi:Glyoxalase/Bleomycin resistance protein/Dihydroxybiphenyl dioxygenase [Trichocladium antarcticum]|uniref:Glyoxalase/Bleomycin resistance protein/Dihydroxybiphenyl dioxygenase n=1 Tax=Trichocladium antarcticum TaxID=1450529 RepID=A0AAN6UKL8_9PEZI|nr:Glyoxalase/Bleomycin resistance protein/Dihydroxybiphenyl dioxygenase [Trichocladium antarcticum]